LEIESKRNHEVIRVGIAHPSLAWYRVAVFRELQAREGIEIELVHGRRTGITNVAPEGFRARETRLPLFGVGPATVQWHGAEIELAGRDRSDVALLSWNPRSLSLPLALRRARREVVGTVLWGHGLSKGQGRIGQWIRDRLGRQADALLFYNDRAKRHYEAHGFGAERLFTAPNSLDQDRIQEARRSWLSDEARLRAFQEQEGLADRPVVLFLSRLLPERRTDLLLEGAKLLLPQFPGLRVVIIGDGEDRARLERRAEELGLSETVIFSGAIFDEMALAPWMLSGAVFGYPDFMGLSLLHAFGYGLPVVTNDRIEGHGPEVEALVPGENGLTFSQGDVRDFARALGLLLADKEQRDRMAARALQTVTERYTIERMVDGMEAAIRYAHARARERRSR